MMLGKTFRRALMLLLVIGVMIAPVAHAEVQPYIGVGEYHMSDFETPNVAQQRAQQRAEQNACEQAGVYLESRTEVIDAQVTKDEIRTMTSGILKIIDVQCHRETIDNKTILFRVTIKANIDSNDVLKWLKKSESEREELVKQNEELRRVIAEQERKIEEFKRRFAEATTPQNKEQITQQVATEEKIFLSNQKVAEGWRIYNQRDYNGAIKLHSEAIEINPNNALAYYGRAYAYDALKDYPRAIEDCTKAVQFDSPRLVDAYNNRGEAYRKSGNFTQAIADYNKALELNPNYVTAYNNRGIAYRRLNNYAQAFADYNKAIELKPDYFFAYYNRAYAYQTLGQYDKALADYNKALELNPNDADARNNRDKILEQMRK